MACHITWLEPRQLGQLASLALVAAMTVGCATGYQRTKPPLDDINRNKYAVGETPLPARAYCARQEFRRLQLDPSQMTAAIGVAGTTHIPTDEGGPQTSFTLGLARVLTEMGFSVVWSPADPYNAALILNTTVSEYTPLTRSITGTDDGDVVVINGMRQRQVAQGKVGAVALLYARVAPGRFHSWTSAASEGRLYMVKDQKNLNAVSKSGWVAIGTGIEAVEVRGTQEMSAVTVQDAAISAVVRAFALRC